MYELAKDSHAHYAAEGSSDLYDPEIAENDEEIAQLVFDRMQINTERLAYIASK